MRLALLMMLGAVKAGSCSGEDIDLNMVPDAGVPSTVADASQASESGAGSGASGDIACHEADAGQGALTLYSPGKDVVVSSLALDANYLYLASQRVPNSGNLLRISKCGGSVVTLATTGGDPTAIAVDSTNVYWFDVSVGVSGMVLRSVSKEGGAATKLADAPEADQVSGIASDGANVYWSFKATTGHGVYSSIIMRTPSLGGASVTLVSGSTDVPFGLALDDDNVYWPSSLPTPTSGPGAVMSVPKAGGATVTLAGGLTAAPLGVAVDGSAVYWTDVAGSFWSVPKSGGPALKIADAPGMGSDWGGITVDSANIYWSSSDSIYAVSKGGGATTLLFKGTAYCDPAGLAADGTSVYWYQGAGRYPVQKAPK